MRTVKEVSRLSGVSIRTLHHYHEIGLLLPTCVTEAGYRLYDQEALKRLQNILFFRELEFPLKDIKELLDSPDFDRHQALDQQIRLLAMEKDRIEALLSAARAMREKGDFRMDFNVFDKSKIDSYKEEVKERWGGTAAYSQFSQKAEAGKDFGQAGAALMEIFAELGKLRHLEPDDAAVQHEIAGLQSFITENFYQCTNEILSGLGKMYASDDRFLKNIDKAGGQGTAEFVSRAIEVFSNNK